MDYSRYPTHAKGEQAYRLRADGLDWNEVGEQVDLKADTARKYALRYAERTGSDWPIVNPLDERAWAMSMKADVDTWVELGERLGVSALNAQTAATRHAERCGLRLPIMRHRDPSRPPAAYHMGVVLGLPWEDVAVALGYQNAHGARNSARYHADQYGLPYDRADRGTVIEGRPERAYQMWLDGHTWGDIAKALDYSCSQSARSVVYKWAEARGIEVPLRCTHKIDPEGAYDLRLDGWTWKDIAELLGYSSDTTAHMAARKYAERNGLEWPIRRAA